jgi:TetR/AcrR family transcriptional repressor of mexJK operon
VILKRRSTKQGRAGRPTSGELERRKARVLDVATNLFIRHGYAATSLVDIASQAGVATRTIYEHFGDKERLFADVIFAPQNAPKLAVPRATENDSLVDALLRVGNYVLAVSLNAKTANMMRLLIAEQNRFPEIIKKLANASFHRFESNVEQVFIDLQLLGRIPAGDHLESACLFVDFVLGAIPLYNYANWLETPPDDKRLKSKVEIFIAGRFGQKVARTAHVPARRHRAAAPYSGRAAIASA